MKNLLLLLLTILFLVSCTAALPDETAVTTVEPIPSVTLADLPSYDLVRPEDSTELLTSAASDLYKLLREISTDITYRDDYISKRDPDSVQPYEILVGGTNRPESAAFIESLAPGEYGYTLANEKIVIAGTNALDTVRAVNLFTEMIMERTSDDGIFYSAADNLLQAADPNSSALTAMSFNILCNRMEKPRVERVLKMLTNYLPDTFGVQEATPEWMKLLKRELGDTYACVGEGRDGGDKGEYSAIFYKTSVFTLLDSGTKWLSDTPGTVSKVEESSLNRIFTYAHLERIADGTELMLVNTHFEHTSDRARERQAEVLADFVDDYSGTLPLLLTGDFNTTAGTNAYNTVLSAGVSDSAALAETAYTASTFTNYGKADTGINFIFVTEDSVAVRDYRVCDEKIDGDYPSDHHPVMIEYIPVG